MSRNLRDLLRIFIIFRNFFKLVPLFVSSIIYSREFNKITYVSYSVNFGRRTSFLIVTKFHYRLIIWLVCLIQEIFNWSVLIIEIQIRYCDIVIIAIQLQLRFINLFLVDNFLLYHLIVFLIQSPLFFLFKFLNFLI